MPTIKQRNDFAAVGDVAFPTNGSQYEYLPFDAQVEFAILADAGDTIRATVHSGSDLLLQNSVIDNKAVTDPIQYPWDYDIVDAAAQGERIGVELSNVGIVNAISRTVIRITPA